MSPYPQSVWACPILREVSWSEVLFLESLDFLYNYGHLWVLPCKEQHSTTILQCAQQAVSHVHSLFIKMYCRHLESCWKRSWTVSLMTVITITLTLKSYSRLIICRISVCPLLWVLACSRGPGTVMYEPVHHFVQGWKYLSILFLCWLFFIRWHSSPEADIFSVQWNISITVVCFAVKFAASI